MEVGRYWVDPTKTPRSHEGPGRQGLKLLLPLRDLTLDLTRLFPLYIFFQGKNQKLLDHILREEARKPSHATGSEPQRRSAGASGERSERRSKVGAGALSRSRGDAGQGSTHRGRPVRAAPPGGSARPSGQTRTQPPV